MNQTPFMNIKAASTYTGLSQNYIRTGCKNNTVPHIMLGTKYMVDVEGLIALAKQQAAVMWKGVN